LQIPDDIAEKVIALKDQYFDLKGLSVYSSMGVGTLRDHIKAGSLPCFKVRGKILIKLSEFNAWIEGYRLNKNGDINNIANEIIESLKGTKSD
jgi:hypothetical protein